MRFRSVCRTHVVAALVLVGVPTTAHAQQTSGSWGGHRPLFVTGVASDANMRTTGEVGVLIPLQVTDEEQVGVRSCACLAAIAAAGPGGHRLAVGPTAEVQWGSLSILGMEALVTVLRTSDAPHHLRPATTYVGVEGGLTLMSFRASVGVQHPVSGPEQHGVKLTGNAGFRLAW